MGLFEGEVVHIGFSGNPAVVKSETTKITDGVPVRIATAVKHGGCEPHERIEAKMLAYVSEQSKRYPIKVPEFIKCYDIYTDLEGYTAEPVCSAMVTSFVDGQTLAKVWSVMSKDERVSIKAQLRQQIELFRKCQQPYIGSIGRQPAMNIYDFYQTTTMGPFDSEIEYDKWCLSQITPRLGPIFGPVLEMWWKLRLHLLRGRDSKAFVLTHGDLAARNIIVRREGIAGGWKIAGIVDWEKSAFLPEWAEYVIAQASALEPFWRHELLDVLKPFKAKKARVRLYALLENSPFWDPWGSISLD
ncbi:hypothetical protein PRK78_000019 [Emydomyces testavorans]|uniref:Aminoglycoside phosphotransferase domain-containing protein n=1 Tax=Emydomyces testavorans TaxID=2070801 RepID=A0AAF0IHA7_9EURO|nr:hypothetical protein PRK78_000019 [Emydomyces testavorans]